MKSGTKMKIFSRGKQRIGRAAATVVLVLALALTGVMPNADIMTAFAATATSLNKTEVTLNSGETFKLKLKGVSKSDVTWTSNKPKVAKVNKNGKVTAKKGGTAKITATYKGKTYTCKITVAGINKWKPTIVVGDTLEMGVANFNGYKLMHSCNWASSDTSIATAEPDDGIITGISPGTTTITAEKWGATFTCTVTVVPAPSLSATVLSLPEDYSNYYQADVGTQGLSLEAGYTCQMALENATGDVTWSVLNQTWAAQGMEVATIDGDGLLYARSGGTATVRATCGGKSYDCQLCVDGINMDVIHLHVGDSISICCWRGGQLVGANYNWANSDTSVVKMAKTGVTSVTLTALAEGTATITQTEILVGPGDSDIDKVASCTVIVDNSSESTDVSDPDLEIYDCPEFIDYLNEQRAAMGLPELEWSDSLEADCVNCFTYGGLLTHTSTDDVAEIIYKTYKSTVEEWYEGFYNEPEHNEIMLADYSWEHTYDPIEVNGVPQGESYTFSGPGSAACVVCHYNGYYYVRVQFSKS